MTKLKNAVQANDAQNGELFAPKYKTLEGMEKALDEISKSEKTVREGLHYVLTSALAHHHACLDKGGSVQTTLSKVYTRILAMPSVNQRMVWNYLRAVLGKNLTYTESKKLLSVSKGKSLVFNATIKQEAGDILYHELPFWRLDANQPELKPWSFIERMANLINMVEEPDKLKMLGKPGSNAFSSQQERDAAIAFKRVLQVVMPDPNKAEVNTEALKDVTDLFTKAKDKPEVLHKAAA